MMQRTPNTVTQIQLRYVVDERWLRPGDILLTTTDEGMSRLVRCVTKSNFSHALIYVGRGHYIDATGKGVQSWYLHRLIFTKRAYCKVLRWKIPLSNPQIASIITYARRQVVKRYTRLDAAFAGVFPLAVVLKLNRQFCSRLVAQAYDAADLSFTANAAYCTPEGINQAKEHLVEVPGCLREANLADLERAREEGMTEIMARVQTKLLRDVRRATGYAVETVEQLSSLVVQFPVYDEVVANLLLKSDYLDLWKQEETKNPWEYAAALFIAHYPDPLARAWMALEGEREEAELALRCPQTLATLRAWEKKTPRKALKLQIILYLNLRRQSLRRQMVWHAGLESVWVELRFGQ